MNIKQFFFSNIRSIVIVVLVLLLIFAVWYVFAYAEPTLSSYTIGNGTITTSVNLSGTVSSSNSVDLSFQEPGQIVKVYVEDGDSVNAGDVLASLDASAQATQLSQAQASLAAAQANYEKLLAGATPENIQTVKDSISSAQQSVSNDYNGALNTLNNGYTSIYNAYNEVLYIHDTYFRTSDQQGIQVTNAKDDIFNNMNNVETYLSTAKTSPTNDNTDTAIAQMVTALNNAYNDVGVVRSASDQGVYDTSVSAADKSALDSQKTLLSASLTNITALQHTIASDKITLQKAQDQLNLTTAPPTQNDIDSAKAQVSSAQAQVDDAQVGINHATIVAPFAGIIRNVTAQSGQVVSPNMPVLSIINNGILKIDAYASETDVTKVQDNAVATVTLDSYGNGVEFPAKVTAVDTAETTFDGLPAYHVTLYFTQPDTRIRAGMTGNVLVTTSEKDNVVEVPSRLILDNGGNNFVLLQNGNQNTMYQITTGLTGDNGMVEVISGLSVGQKISDF